MDGPPVAHKPRLVRRRLLLMDYAFLALGAVSLLILALSFSSLPPREIRILRYADYAAVGLFGLTFFGKLIHSDHPLRFLRTHWFAALGLLPLTTPILLPDRFYIVVQIVIVLSRFGQALNRAFVGAHVAEQVVAHYRALVVEELTDPILDRLLHVLQVNLSSGRYTESVGNSLDAHRADVHAAVVRAVRASPKLTALTKFPGVDAAVHNVAEEAVDAAIAALKSEELVKAIQESIDDAFEDLRRQVRTRRWHDTGVGLKDVAAGLVKGTA